MSQAKLIGFRLFIVLIWVLSICLFDALVGIFYNQITPEFGRKNLAVLLDGATKRRILTLTPHAYLVYENTPNYEAHGYRQHNNQGYRNSNNLVLEKNDLIIRVLALGGSTTYSRGVDNPEDSWVEKLQAIVNDTLKYSTNYQVEIINGGLPWGTSGELLNHYLFRDRYLDIDLVIVHSGGNDIGPLFYADYTPEYNNWRYPKATGQNGLRPGEKSIITMSNTIRAFYALWYSRISYTLTDVYVHTNSRTKVKPSDGLENVKGNEPLGYERNLGLLFRNIVDDSTDVIFFQFYDPGRSLASGNNKEALEQALRTTDYLNHLEASILALHKNEAVSRNLCLMANIDYLKIPDDSIPVEYFIDQCHLNATGQMFKAKFLYEKVLEHVMTIINKREIDKK